LFDIFNFSAPEVEKIKDIAYLSKQKLLILLHAYSAIINEQNLTEVDAVFYSSSIYKLYDNTPIKISVENDFFEGIEGFYYGKYRQYPFKKHITFLEKASDIHISNKQVLISLEKFLKSIWSKYKESHAQPDLNYFSQNFITMLVEDIPIRKINLEQYNNIAYYFEKLSYYDQASQLLEQIIRINSNRIVAYLNLADTYWGLGDKEKSKLFYQQYKDKM